MKTAVTETLKAYLNEGGPSKGELNNGAALANWAVLKGVGFPQLQAHQSLRVGTWGDLWAPLSQVLKARGFENLRPFQVLILWQESQSEPARFERLLGRDGVLDPRVPKERNRGRDLREAVGRARAEMKTVRASVRFEDAGWQFTSTAFLNPAGRIVRLAVSGSQPCKITGSQRTLNLNLKGRLFEDLDSPSGLKVQIVEQKFLSRGCELSLTDRVDSVQRLAGGGEAKIAGGLNLAIKDEIVSGRFQIDLVSKQAGVSLLTGRAVYSLRGKVSHSGELVVRLVPISSSGSRLLRQLLEKEGSLTGSVSNSAGSGKILIPVLKDPLNWNDTTTQRTRR